MVSRDSAEAVYGPGVRMASWSFYLGLIGLLAIVLSPALRGWTGVLPFLIYGGLGLSALAVVLGLVGLPSINRTGALAGLLLGILAIAGYYFLIRPMVGM